MRNARSAGWASATTLLLGLMICLGWAALPAAAQAGGAIEGTVTDSAGAVIPNATVTATNVSTGVSTSRTTTSAGFFSITLLIPGKYTVTVSVAGFETFKQENFVIDNEHVSGLNPILRVGVQSETVTVTDEPPELETTNAGLGGLIRQDVVTELPIMLLTTGASAQQRDITAFSNLLPGAQLPAGGRVSQFNGMPQRTAEIYLDGIPLTLASAQADNRVVYNVVPLESIGEVQAMNSGFTSEYQGAGFLGLSTSSGGSQYHGAIYGLIRNTVFDAWSFASKCGPPGQPLGAAYTGCGNTSKVIQSGALVTVAGPKPGEHQDEYGITGGGPLKLPHVAAGREKIFFYGSYSRFRQTIGVNPTAVTIPTTLMQQGNFQELLPTTVTGGLGNQAGVNYPIYDPTTQAACTANSTNGPCRYQYGYGHGTGTGPAGNPTLLSAANVNVIPASEISPQMKYWEQWLPTPTNNVTGAITNNYLGGTPTGYNNWLWSVRGDYVISDKNRLFALFADGDRVSVPYNGSSVLPLPYMTSYLAHVKGHIAEVQESYTITPNLSNQLRYGYLYFGGPPIMNATMGVSQYEPAAAGITGLPPGQASLDFPAVSFSGSNDATTWNNGSASYTSVSETYDLVDNVLWTKGRNAMSFGFQYQWLETNADSADTNSLQLTLPMSTNETANLASASSYTNNSGYAYASYMLGAIGSPSVTQQPFSVYGMRFHPFAPYFQDDFKATSKLTLNLGLRWDYFPTYREVLNRWSFLNPTAVNPITGNSGALEFAGNWGGSSISCNCTSPVNQWRKNFAPRVGFAYSLNNKTVIRGAYAIMYTHAGGVGGGSSNDGTGLNGFQVVTPFTDSYSGASFYLNSNPSFPASGGGNVTGPNANFGGAGFSFPAVTSINITSTPALANTAGALTGNYVCAGQTIAPCYGKTSGYASASSISYPDPYYGGRAPEIQYFNLGVQRELTKAMTISANYVGTLGHLLPGNNNLRGLQSNQINPTYLSTVGVTNLNLPATTANIATVQAACGNCLPAVPYAGYTAAAAVSSTPTIGHMLTWMPQYSGVNDTFALAANAEYNALQLTLNQRLSKGLTMTVNYTYSKTLDDDGTIRSGWPIPASAFASYAPQQNWKADRIDRSRSTTDLPQLLNVFGVYKLPFGSGGIGASNRAVRWVAGGWELSGISTYSSGLPLAIVGSAASVAQNFGQGQVMMDMNPSFHGSPRINGKWGSGSTAENLGTLPYITGYLSSTGAGLGAGSLNTLNSGTSTIACGSSVGPFCNTQTGTIGDAPRVAPYSLRGPSAFRLTMSVNRTFDITNRVKFVFRVDCNNVTNHVTFGNLVANNQIGVNPTSTAFGTVGYASNDSRAFQFQGRIKF